MHVQYARTEHHEAYLNTPFGRSFVQSQLGFSNDIIEAIVGRYSKGKRKGQLRGTVTWKKTVEGGWVRGQGVRYPGLQHDSIEIWINHHTPSAKRVY